MIFWLSLGFAAGLALILSEFFLPGVIAGLIGLTLIMGSAGFGMYTYPAWGLLIFVGAIAAVLATVTAGMVILARTGAANRLMLHTSNKASEGFIIKTTDPSLVGARGVVLTALRPAGTIRVGEHRLDAISNGAFVDKGAEVRVLELRGSRVVVEQAEE